MCVCERERDGGGGGGGGVDEASVCALERESVCLRVVYFYLCMREVGGGG